MNLSKAYKQGENKLASISILLLYLYAFSLPLRFNLKGILLLVLVGLFLWRVVQKQVPWASLFQNTTFRILCVYFMVCALSILVSAEPHKAIRFVTLQAMLPVLPMLFYRQLSRRQVHHALLAFTLSCFLLSLHSLYVIGMDYSREEISHIAPFPTIDWSYISYYMPHKADFHAPYYSFFIGICLLIHSFFLFNISFIRQRKGFFLHLFLFLYFFAFQALLASRTALVATVFIMALVALYLSLRAGKYVLVLAVILVTAGSSLLVYQKVPYLKEKFSTSAGVSQREMMWRSALDLIWEHPVLGTGTGDIEESLVTKYRQYHFREGAEVRMDAHNQYLMHGASMGLPGTFMLLLLFLHLLLKAYRNKDYLLFATVAVFAICCLTESMLQRRDGTLLFTFMVALLLFAPKEALSSTNSSKP